MVPFFTPTDEVTKGSRCELELREFDKIRIELEEVLESDES